MKISGIFFIFLLPLLLVCQEPFAYTNLMPSFKGIVKAKDNSIIFYGNNGTLQIFNNKDTISKTLDISKDIHTIHNHKDTLFGAYSDGSLITSTNNGLDWTNKTIPFKINKPGVLNFKVSNNYFILFDSLKVYILDRNYDSVFSANLETRYQVFTTTENKAMLLNDTLYYTYSKNNTAFIQSIDLKDVMSVSKGFHLYAKKYLGQNYTLSFIENTKNKYIFLSRELYEFTTDTFLFFKNLNTSFVRLYSGDKYKYSVQSIYNSNQSQVNIIRLDNDYTIKDTLKTVCFVHGINRQLEILLLKDYSILEDNEKLYIANIDNLKLLITNFKDIEITSVGARIINTYKDDDKYLCSTFPHFPLSIEQLIKSKSNTFSAFNKEQRFSSIYSFFSQPLDEIKEPLRYFTFAIKRHYSLDTLKTLIEYPDSILSSGINDKKDILYLGSIDGFDYFYVFSIDLFQRIIVKTKPKLSPEVVLTTNFYVSGASFVDKDNIIINNYSKNKSGLANISLYNIKNKTVDTLIKYSSLYFNNKSFFTGKNKDTLIMILYNDSDANNKVDYKIYRVSIKSKNFELLDSNLSTNFPNSFFISSDKQQYVTGPGYLRNITTGSRYNFSSYREYIPRKDVNHNLITAQIKVVDEYSDNYALSGEFILTPKSTTSVESPQIEESAYLYTYPPRPNPATQSVSAEVYWNSAYTLSESNISVYDIYGSKYNSNITFTSKEPFRAIINADCTNLATGIYFIRISVNGEYKTIPFTVVK
jgi:hypothetical protein